jgi:hypothetical protein
MMGIPPLHDTVYPHRLGDMLRQNWEVADVRAYGISEWDTAETNKHNHLERSDRRIPNEGIRAPYPPQNGSQDCHFDSTPLGRPWAKPDDEGVF